MDNPIISDEALAAFGRAWHDEDEQRVVPDEITHPRGARRSAGLRAAWPILLSDNGLAEDSGTEMVQVSQENVREGDIVTLIYQGYEFSGVAYLWEGEPCLADEKVRDLNAFTFARAYREVERITLPTQPYSILTHAGEMWVLREDGRWLEVESGVDRDSATMLALWSHLLRGDL